MSDAATVADQKPASDLRVLVTGSPERVTIKDKKGVDHSLQPLDLADLCEFEDKAGQSIFGSTFANMKIRDIAYMLFLSVRKEDCSMTDLEARRFKYTERQVHMLFDLSFIAKCGDIFVDLLRISGMDLRPQKASQ